MWFLSCYICRLVTEKNESHRHVAVTFVKADLRTHSFPEVFRPLPSYLPCSELEQWLHDTFYGLHNKKSSPFVILLNVAPGCSDKAVCGTLSWLLTLRRRQQFIEHRYWWPGMVVDNSSCYFTWIMCLAIFTTATFFQTVDNVAG